MNGGSPRDVRRLAAAAGEGLLPRLRLLHAGLVPPLHRPRPLNHSPPSIPLLGLLACLLSGFSDLIWLGSARFDSTDPPSRPGSVCLLLMAVAVPSTLPMKLWRSEPRGKSAAPGPDDPVRVLVTVTVLGSAGPLRFIVQEGDTVAALIRAALRCYAREGRMPLLGTDHAGFVLSTANGGSGGTLPVSFSFLGIWICSASRLAGSRVIRFHLFDLLCRARAVLKEDEKITFNGCRSFLLWQKTAVQGAANDAGHEALTATRSPARKGGFKATPSPGRKSGGGWKAGLNKFLLSFSIKV